MADVAFVDEADNGENFAEDGSHLFFVGDLLVDEVGEGEVLHDEVCDVFVKIEVESVVADDTGVSQCLDVQEVLFEL